MTLTHTVAKDVAAITLREAYIHSEHSPEGAWPMLMITRSADVTYGVWGLDESFPVLLFRALTKPEAWRKLQHLRSTQPITLADVT